MKVAGRLAALATASVLGLGVLGNLGVSPAAAASVDVPQAPVLSVISKDESLPFTLSTGMPIQVAVLTGSTSVDDATWTSVPDNSLSLADYGGKTIRVLARQAGVTDPSLYFDASYDVRDAYASAVGLGTDSNKVEAVLGATPPIAGWASGYKDYQPGTNVADSWKTPDHAVGPIGGSADDPYSNNTYVVVLGDHGQITMTFDNPIVDGAGNDFAVFENGFRVSGSTLDFIELGRVQVSSNGTDFVEFDSATLNDKAVSAYGGAAANLYGGLAGRDLNSYGTPFDLTALKNKPAVRSGKVDLNNITQVKIVDVVGDGNDLDSFGRPIYDAYPTSGSGGFDLRGVGALHQKGATVGKLSAAGVNATTVNVSAAASTSADVSQSVTLEMSQQADDHSDAVVKATETLPAGSDPKKYTWAVSGFTANQTVWFRASITGSDGTVQRTDWLEFTKVPAVVSILDVPYPSRTGDDTLSVNFRGSIAINTDGPQDVWVEYSANADHSDAKTTTVLTASVTGLAYITQAGLPLWTPTWYRFVAKGSDGQVSSTDWTEYIPQVDPGVQTPVTVVRIGDRAQVRLPVLPGTTDTTVLLDYATSTSYTDKVRLGPVTVSKVTYPGSAVFDLTGLDTTKTYYVRGLLTRSDGTLSATSNVTVRAATTPAANVPTVAVAGTKATVSATVSPGSYGPAVRSIEYTSDPAKADITKVDSDATTAAYAVALTNLTPGTTYWARSTATFTHPWADSYKVTSDWTEFSTPALTDALGAVSANSVTTGTATVAVPVSPGAFDRTVSVTYLGADGTSVTSPAQTVAASDQTTTVEFALSGLVSNTPYAVTVSSVAAGSTETGSVRFTTQKVPASLAGAPAVGELSPKAAAVVVPVLTGDLAQRVAVEYTVEADHSDTVRSSAVVLPAATVAQTATVRLKGLAPRTAFFYRVMVTASDGDEVAGDWMTFVTPAVNDPSVSLSVSSAAVRVGNTVTLKWSTTNAETATASGSWSGVKPTSGTTSIKVTKPGAQTFTLTVQGEGGATVGSVKVQVSLPAAKYSVSVVRGPTKIGGALRVNASGLAAGEAYTISVAGIKVGTGKAQATGKVSQLVTIPRVLSEGLRTVTVTGSMSDRTGSTSARVVTSKTLTTKVSKTTLRRNQTVKLTVSGLAPFEPVRVWYAGKLVSRSGAIASSSGTYTISFKVGTKTGSKSITVNGLDASRKVTRTLRVTR